MTPGSSQSVERATPTASKYTFVALLVLLLAVAIGHLYAIEGLTTLYGGLPLWSWLQLGIVAGMLVITWFAVRIVTEAPEGEI